MLANGPARLCQSVQWRLANRKQERSLKNRRELSAGRCFAPRRNAVPRDPAARTNQKQNSSYNDTYNRVSSAALRRAHGSWYARDSDGNRIVKDKDGNWYSVDSDGNRIAGTGI